MIATIAAALISAAASLAVCLVNDRCQRAAAEQKHAETISVIQCELKNLARQVEKHNSIVERTYRLEGQVTELQHDIRDLKQQKG